MANSDRNFNELEKGGKIAAARNDAPQPKYPPPFSLRLTFEERAKLEKLAAGMSLGAYIRDRLFGEDASPRRIRGKTPIKDHEALGQVLGALGASRLSNNLNQLARAAHSGSLPVSDQTEAALIDAYDEIVAMRQDLLRALGHHAEDSS